MMPLGCIDLILGFREVASLTQPNSTSSWECLYIGSDHPTPPNPPHPPMKLCVVVVVEPLTLEMFQAAQIRAQYRADIK